MIFPDPVTARLTSSRCWNQSVSKHPNSDKTMKTQTTLVLAAMLIANQTTVAHPPDHEALPIFRTNGDWI